MRKAEGGGRKTEGGEGARIVFLPRRSSLRAGPGLALIYWSLSCLRQLTGSRESVG